jgi:non-heme chloroperoxidase
MADRGLAKIDLGRIPLFRDIDGVTIGRDVEDWIFFYRDGQRVCVQGERSAGLGGTGRPLIFLAGLGNTAHIWDNLAPKFTDKHHVYAITRRGFGRSTHANTGYTPERLADDVLAVMDQLKIEKPVLVGHSIAGEELSFIGTNHADRITALIYLDAAYTYAFYDAAGYFGANLNGLQEAIDALARAPGDTSLMDQVRAKLARFEESLNRKANSAENPCHCPMLPQTQSTKPTLLR